MLSITDNAILTFVWMSKRIVLIDDDPEDIEIMLELLKDERPNYNAVAFTDPCYALDLLKAMPDELLPDFIVLDVNMPKMDGLECLKSLIAIPKLRNVSYAVHGTVIPDSHTVSEFKKLGVNVRRKPNTLDEFTDFFRSIH